MTKKHQKAFNEAFLRTVKSKDRKLVPDKRNKRYTMMVPVGTIMKNFKKFVKTVNKDLGYKTIMPRSPESSKTKTK